jgi:hypothetical protein
MRKILAGLTFATVILTIAPVAIAENLDIQPNGFAVTDRQNGVTVDSRGFRSSWVSAGSTGYIDRPPVYYHRDRHHHHPIHHSAIYGGPVIGPVVRPVIGPVVRPVVIPIGRPRGVIIAPTFNFGGSNTFSTCTTTNTITSSDGTVFRSTTTQPCGF